MSTLRVPITTIKSLKKHPNAEKLEIAKCFDYEVVVQSGKFHTGQVVVYVPVGAILSDWLEDLVFGKDSKIHRSDNRIRAMKLRGIVSQGMIIDPFLLKSEKNLDIVGNEMDKDVAEYLG